MDRFEQLVDDILQEGKHDKHIFKGIIVAGPPGAGKSYILNNYVNDGSLKVLDMDVATEYLTKKLGFEDQTGALDYRKLSDEQKTQLADTRQQAARKTWGRTENPAQKHKGFADLYVEGGLGTIFSITGSDYKQTIQMHKFFKNRGYENMMVVVNAPLDVCLFANSKRSRKIPEDILRDKHKKIQENLPKFQKYFGNDFVVYDNIERTGRSPGPKLADLGNKVRSFLARPNTNKIYLQHKAHNFDALN